MEFEVVGPARGTPKGSASVVLVQDRWDDFGFKTQYHLYYLGPEFNGFVGNVKILKLGQQETSGSLLPPGRIGPLPIDFCSLGQSLDYYERLAALPKIVRGEILTFLRDALVYPEHAQRFVAERGWKTSVTRDLDLDSYLPLARILLERDYDDLPSVGITLTFHMAGWSLPLRLNFSAPKDGPRFPQFFVEGRMRSGLPERIAVITGRNGSGKSTLLARLARVLHASQADRRRKVVSRLGTIEPPGIGFTRIITVSYSAFDTFQVPGVDVEEKRQIITDLRGGTGRYVFAGLRDIARELEERLNDADQATARVPDDRFALDRQDRTHLKSSEQLADEYERMIASISDVDRVRLFNRALTPLLADPSFSDIPDPMGLLNGAPRAMFMGWSTGQKIVMHTALTLVAYTNPKSIVLIDEPESHLHPPLLAALMHAVRVVLEEQDAFAVVGTHSPVVAQETLGRHVSVISRVNDIVTILEPKIETYGESIGEITEEVFGLYSGATDFHQTLRALVEAGSDLEAIEKLFDRGMSLQARAYVMSLLGGRGA
ncbi:AAA family ATPase [Methylocystis parvus]|uniref:AAA family ATPase n=1 Tax=Methylocystis parvus TaxID=134 RepID=UPI003C72BFA7